MCDTTTLHTDSKRITKCYQLYAYKLKHLDEWNGHIPYKIQITKAHSRRNRNLNGLD